MVANNPNLKIPPNPNRRPEEQAVQACDGMSKNKARWIGSDPKHVLNGAKEINKCLESLFPTEDYQGHEDVLVMALISRIGVIEARRLLGTAS